MKVNFRIIFNLLLGVYFSAWILSIRDNDSHGLVSNLLALFEKPLSVDLLFAGINYLTSFSVYGFALTMFPKEVDYYSFFISFSPLPLGFHDGERMIDSQTIIPGIPAPESAISIIYRTGILIVFVFYFSIGYLANNTSRKLPAKSFYSAMVLAIFLFAVLFSLQYNLRGFFRLLSSAWLIAVVAPSLKKYKIKL